MSFVCADSHIAAPAPANESDNTNLCYGLSIFILLKNVDNYSLFVLCLKHGLSEENPDTF